VIGSSKSSPADAAGAATTRFVDGDRSSAVPALATLGSDERPLRIGTRGSALALAQAEVVASALRQARLGLAIRVVVISTEGDRDKISPLTVIGGRGVFTSALQEALARGEIDAAVHSAKDLPSEEAPGMLLAAFLDREDARDVVVSRHGRSLADLPPSPTIGTSSRRRAAQVLALRPDAKIVELRGNVDTRLRKALDPAMDAIVLAAAGVARLDRQNRVAAYVPLDTMVPAPGQGALAVEIRVDDEAARRLVAPLDVPDVSAAVKVERAVLRALGAGCTTPVGAHAIVEGDGRILLRVMLASEDGDASEQVRQLLDPRHAERDAGALARRMMTSLDARARPPLPLAGLSVLVTRAAAQAGGLGADLRSAGARIVFAPTLRIEDPGDHAPLERALDRLVNDGYDWVVVSSVNAAERVLAHLAERQNGPEALGRASIAAVGPATAAPLLERGLAVTIPSPERQDGDGLVAVLSALGLEGRRVLFPCGDRARNAIPDGLRAWGAMVDRVVVYRTVTEAALDPAVRSRIRRGEVDVVTFASPSSVTGLAAVLNGEMVALRRAVVACIGGTTARAAEAVGLAPAVIADDPSDAGLVAAIVRHVRDHPLRPMSPSADGESASIDAAIKG